MIFLGRFSHLTVQVIFERNVLAAVSGSLNLVQVDAEVTSKGACVGCVEGFEEILVKIGR
jgi:hypothetical protein